MTTNVLTINPTRKIRIRAISLPNEHGSWAFLFEPLVAAIALAPTISSVWISIFVIGAFLVRRPLNIFISDLKTKRNPEQTKVAYRFIHLYAAISSFGLFGSLFLVGIEHFIPFALVIPLAIYQVYCDVAHKNRRLLPELTGAIAISSSSAVIVLAGGWSMPAAFALWGIFIVRLLPSITYIRNRLMLEKGKEFSTIPVIAMHIIALGGVGILAVNGLASKLTVAMFAVLLGRASIGLSPYRRKMKAMKIGIREVIYGVLVVLSIILGYYLGI